jgi:prolyl-tRNA editing enzyme YbaK/EbsC (Cys-tRNA(Pro) deacylase)
MSTDPIIEQLHDLGEPFEIIDCDPDLADTAQFCETYGYGMHESANAIIVAGKADPKPYAACLVLATTRLDVNGAVKRKLGTRKASFAAAEDTVSITGMKIGGVTPFGLPADLPLWIDARVMELDRVIVGGGSRNRKIYVAPAALARLASAEVVTDLAKVPPPPE